MFLSAIFIFLCKQTAKLNVRDKMESKAPSGQHPYLVYLLVSSVNPRRTYVGSTNNMTRRLRQHNSELVGGARYTHTCQPWTVAVTVTGFETHQQALQFEWAWKHIRTRGSGVTHRMKTLEVLLAKEQWTSRAPPAASVPLHVTVQ